MVLKIGPNRLVQPGTGALSGPILWKNRKFRKIGQKLETGGSTVKTTNRSGWTSFGPVWLISKLRRFGLFFLILNLTFNFIFLWFFPHAASPFPLILTHANDSLPSRHSFPLDHALSISHSHRSLPLTFTHAVSISHSHSHGDSRSHLRRLDLSRWLELLFFIIFLHGDLPFLELGDFHFDFDFPGAVVYLQWHFNL